MAREVRATAQAHRGPRIHPRGLWRKAEITPTGLPQLVERLRFRDAARISQATESERVARLVEVANGLRG